MCREGVSDSFISNILDCLHYGAPLDIFVNGTAECYWAEDFYLLVIRKFIVPSEMGKRNKFNSFIFF